MTAPLKAYIVTEPENNTGGVIYAKSDIEARRQGADEYNEGELGGMSCRRAPALDDKCGDQRATTEYLLSRGWGFESAAPGHGTLYADDNPYVSRGGDVYPTPYHWLAEAAASAIEQANTQRIREWAGAKWWYAEIATVRKTYPRGWSVTLWLPHLRFGVTVDLSDPGKIDVISHDRRAWLALYQPDFMGLATQLPTLLSTGQR